MRHCAGRRYRSPSVTGQPRDGGPLQGNAVVLIDEIDLHLHPQWQRRAIKALPAAFPNCQFIVSTHSAQVLSEVRPEKVRILRRIEGGVEVVEPRGTYGLDSVRVLEDVMDTPGRPAFARQELGKLFDLIDDGEFERAKDELKRLRHELGPEPELDRAQVRLDWLRGKRS